MVVSLLKLKAWIKAHWDWLVLVGLFCLAYLLGKKDSGTLLAQAKIAKNQYKDDNDSLQRLQEEKKARENKIEEITEKVERQLQEKREEQLEELKKQTTSPDDVFQDIGITKK